MEAGLAYSGSFCEKLLEASPLPEAMPAGSKMGSLQTVSETISDGDSDSGITDIRRKKIVIAQKLLCPEKIGVTISSRVRGTTLQTPRSVQ